MTEPIEPTPQASVLRRAARKAARTAGEAVGPHLLTRVNHLEHLTTQLELARDHLADTAEGISTNLELLKAEFRGLLETVEHLGLAIAPATGLAGAEARLVELRERVNFIDRQVRSLTPPTSDPSSGVVAASGNDHDSTVADPEPAVGGSGFDYIGFEHRFRGDADTATALFAERYLPLLQGHAPVLDIGCGRGELVELLQHQGIEARGVDIDADMVAEAVGRGLTATHADGAAYLRAQAADSLGAVTAIHVVEHLPLNTLVELLELTASRLAPGGVFIAETPNPASLIVLGNSYIMDPSHEWPLHPSLLSFLCERAGFSDIELRHYSPATDYHLPLVEEAADTPPWVSTINTAFSKLNEVLFGPQEYAVLARKR